MSKSKNDKNELPKGWEWKNLSTVVEINSGISLPQIFKNGYNDGEIEFFKVAQMNNHEKFMINSEILFTIEIAKKNKIKLFPKGSVLIPKRGGAIATNKKRLLLKDASYDSNIMGLKADNKILSDTFLFSFLQSVDLSNFLDESTIPQINNKHIDRIQIPLPPLPEQQRIVQKLDGLFEHLNKAIALTKENLEHCHHLLPAALNEVFGDAEEKGWKIIPFEQTVTNLDGKRIPIKADKRDKGTGQYPYYGASGIIDYVDDYISEGENLLISEDGANLVIRKYPIAFIATGKYWVNNHAHVVCAKQDITTNNYLAYFFAYKDISAFITGAAQPKLSQKKLNEIPVILPDLDMQSQIVNYLNQLSQQQQQLQQHYLQQLQQLEQLKSSALDAAFKGEL